MNRTDADPRNGNWVSNLQTPVIHHLDHRPYSALVEFGRRGACQRSLAEEGGAVVAPHSVSGQQKGMRAQMGRTQEPGAAENSQLRSFSDCEGSHSDCETETSVHLCVPNQKKKGSQIQIVPATEIEEAIVVDTRRQVLGIARAGSVSGQVLVKLWERWNDVVARSAWAGLGRLIFDGGRHKLIVCTFLCFGCALPFPRRRAPHSPCANKQVKCGPLRVGEWTLGSWSRARLSALATAKVRTQTNVTRTDVRVPSTVYRATW